MVVPAKAGTHNHHIPIEHGALSVLACRMYVYMLASGRHGTIYVGVTNSMRNRLEQHRAGIGSAFVAKHKVYRLVYLENCENPEDAIRREKQFKNWKREWKIRLIEEDNPQWDDLGHLLID